MLPSLSMIAMCVVSLLTPAESSPSDAALLQDLDSGCGRQWMSCGHTAGRSHHRRPKRHARLLRRYAHDADRNYEARRPGDDLRVTETRSTCDLTHIIAILIPTA
jgi:hypothetical protein